MRAFSANVWARLSDAVVCALGDAFSVIVFGDENGFATEGAVEFEANGFACADVGDFTPNRDSPRLFAGSEVPIDFVP